MRRLLAALPLAVLGALALLFGAYALHHDPQVKPQALVGKPLPDLVLPALDGEDGVRLRGALAGPFLLNIYASWCGPCEVEAPALMQLKAAGAPLLGVAYKDAPAQTRAFLARVGHPYAATLVDRDGRAGIELGVTGVPETYLVDGQGIIVAKHTGPLTARDARDLAARLTALR